MSRAAVAIVASIATVAAAVIAAAAYVRSTGLVTRGEPGFFEARIAEGARRLAIPANARNRQNPVPSTPETLAEARSHYADHCAVCHGADGRGRTDMGQGLWPKAPDMRLPETQERTDGELFWIIENGIRFTGMPGWTTGTADGEEASWHLVHLLRRLPTMTDADAEEIAAAMPRSPEEVRQEIEAERFLSGEP
jgi:mono/diheme cytochrome c family protein